MALINNDGYWVRASDYNIFLDEKGIFKLVPHDMNETFSGASMGPGGPGSAVDLDPLVALDDPSKPLRSKLLRVPSLLAKYLRYVYEVAEKGLDWQTLGPVVEGHRERGFELVKIDSRKLSSNEAYEVGTSSESSSSGRELTLKRFADQRRKFLMNHAEVLKAVKERE